MKRLFACLLLALLLSGCAGKNVPAPSEPPQTAPSASEAAPTVTPNPAREPKPSEEPAARETDGSENLGYFVVYPADGVLEVPMMGLRLPLSGALLENEGLLVAEAWVERSEATLYLSMVNSHPGQEEWNSYDYIFLEVWGSRDEQEGITGLVRLGQNEIFHYYYLNYADMVDLYPEYFTEQASYMTAEENAAYDAFMADAAGVMADAEILPLKLPETPKPEELGEWFTAAVLPDLDGNEVSLGELIAGNKLTLINIWGTFCGPCIREMPDLADLARAYEGQGFGVVGLACDILDTSGRIQPDVVADAWDILESAGVEYPVLILSPELERATDLMYVPTSYFVDGTGHVLDGPLTGSMSGEEWQELIEKHLAGEG